MFGRAASQWGEDSRFRRIVDGPSSRDPGQSATHKKVPRGASANRSDTAFDLDGMGCRGIRAERAIY